MIGHEVKIYVAKSNNFKDGYNELKGKVISKKKKYKNTIFYLVDCGEKGRFYKLFTQLHKIH